MIQKTQHFQFILSDVYSLSERFFIDANNVKQTQLKLGSTSDFTEVKILTFHTNVATVSTEVSDHHLCKHTQHAVLPSGLQAGPPGQKLSM